MKSFLSLALLAVYAAAKDITADNVSLEDFTAALTAGTMDELLAATGAADATAVQELATANALKAGQAEVEAAIAQAKEEDAKEKAKVADADKEGKAYGNLTNVLDIAEFPLSTGGVGRGILTVKTAWKKSTGVDAETTLMFWWDIDPTADYDKGDSELYFLTSASNFTEKFEVSSFSRSIFSATQVVQKYNYMIVDRSKAEAITQALVAAEAAGSENPEADAPLYLLSDAEQAALGANQFAFTQDAEGKFGATEKMKSSQYWALDAVNTSYDLQSGAQTVTMMRKNAGVQEAKVGGAFSASFIFSDPNGVQADGGYVGFANDPDAETDGATAVTTYAALAIAAVAALF